MPDDPSSRPGNHMVQGKDKFLKFSWDFCTFKHACMCVHTHTTKLKY